MQFIDAFNLILSVLGTYGLMVSLRLLLPRNVVPRVSNALKEAESRLHDAEVIHAISNVSQYRIDLAILGQQFLGMRRESHRSPGFFQQLGLVFLCGLRYRLYVLSSQVEAIKLKIELAVDERRLIPPTTVQGVTTALPASAPIVATPISISEPTPPSPAALS
ncbi:hypothetical protein BJV74DRAFT_882317 [Russula compacta]|nr:hypothetical protein BJV74DRAFT_882317 [Russula compacta]